MQLTVQVYTINGGITAGLPKILEDWSAVARDVRISYGEHGALQFTCVVPRGFTRAQALFRREALLIIKVAWGARPIWTGFLEDMAHASGGLKVTALGGWSRLNDLPYTALWSLTKTGEFRPLTLQDRGTSRAEKFELDTNNGIFIALKKNEAYTAGATNGRLGYQIPDASTRNMIGVQFDVALNLPTQYTARLVSVSGGFGGTVTVEWTLAGTGAAVSRSLHVLNTSADALFFEITPNTNNTYAGETGDSYVQWTNIRVVTATTNRVNTTLTANLTATPGTPVSATVGSTANMYVGQRLVIDSASATSESVVVTEVTDSTHFKADFANNHTSGNAVQGHVIYTDEVVKDVLTAYQAFNTNVLLHGNTIQINAPGYDQPDLIFEDQLCGDVLTDMAARGDNATTPRVWEIGIDGNLLLYFRPRAAQGTQTTVNAQVWLVDLADDDTFERSYRDLQNSAYAIYKDANDRTLRTAVADDTAAQTRQIIKRRGIASTDTTSATAATLERSRLLNQRAALETRTTLQPLRLYNQYGGRVPLWMIRPGDILVPRNLIARKLFYGDYSQVGFVVREAEYDLEADTLKVAPAESTPALDLYLARIAKTLGAPVSGVSPPAGVGWPFR